MSQLSQSLKALIGEDESLESVEEAALFVQLARNGQRIGGISLTSRAKICYRLRHKYQAIFRLAAWCLLGIHFFQRPLWTFHEDDWADGAVFPQSGVPYMPYTLSVGLSCVCLAVIGIASYLEVQYERSPLRWRLMMTMLFGLFLQTFGHVVTIARMTMGKPPIVSMSPAEILFVVLIEPFYANNILYLSLTIPTFLGLMATLGFVVCAYTGVGFLVFAANSPEAQQVFSTYGNALWTMLMTLNASNWPSPILPAYSEDRFYFIYFIVFLVIVNWGLVNLVLGFVYAFFRLEQLSMFRKFKAVRRKNMEMAFRALDEEQVGFITYPVVDNLLKELYLNFSTLTTLPTDRERFALARNLDPNGDGRILMEDFLHLEKQCFGDAVEAIRSALYCERLATTALPSPRSERDRNSLRNSFRNSFRNSETSNVSKQSNHDRAGSGSGPQSMRISQNDSFASGFMSPFDSCGTPTSSANGNDKRALSGSGSGVGVGVGIGVGIGQHEQDSDNYSSNLNPIITGITGYNDVLMLRSGGSGDDASSSYPIIPAVEPYRKHTLQDLQAMRCPRSCLEAQHSFVLVVESDIFCIFVDCVSFALGVVYEVTLDRTVLVALVAMCSLESLVRVVIKGWYRCKKSYRNSYDILVTALMLASSLVLLIARYLHPDDNSEDVPQALTQGVVLLRIISFPRVVIFMGFFTKSERNFRHALRYVLRGAGDFLFLLLALFGLLYCFAAIGIQCFGGAIRKTGHGSADIYSSPYGENGYWPLNFNDMSSGMATTFVLLSVNNMHVICSGFVAAVGDYWPRLYFTFFWMFGPLLLLNVVTSFFLNELVSWQSHQVQEAALKGSSPKHPEGEAGADGAADVLAMGRDENTNALSLPLSLSSQERSLVVGAPQGVQGVSREPTIVSEPAANTSLSLCPSVSVSVVPTPRDLSVDDSRFLSSRLQTSEEGLRESGADGHSDSLARMRAERVFSNSLFADADERRALAAELLARREVMRRRFLSNVSAASMMSDDGGSRQLSIHYDPQKEKNYEPAGTAEEPAIEQPSHSKSFLSGLFGSPTGTEKDLTEPLLASSVDGGTVAEKTASFEGRAAHPLRSRSRPSSWRSTLEELLSSQTLKAEDVAAKAHETQPVKVYEAAAMLVQFARDGVDHDIHLTRRVLNIWRLRQKLKYLLRLCSWMLVAIVVFERPFWTYHKQGWDQPNFPGSGVCKISPIYASYMKLPLICLLLTGLVLETGYKRNIVALRNFRPMTIFRQSLIILSVFQLVTLVYVVVTNSITKFTTRIPVCSVLYVLWFDSRTLARMRVITSIFPKLLALILLFALMIMAFASFGPLWSNIHNLEDDDDFNRTQFASVQNSFWSIFVAITSSGYPQQVLPLYRRYRLFFLYFFAFITLGAFGMLNLVFVLVLLLYNKAMQSELDRKKITRQMLLMKAFETMDVEKRGWLDYREMSILLDELYKYYHDFRKSGVPDKEKKKLMIKIVDVDGDGCVSFNDFVFLIDVTRLKLSFAVQETYLQTLFPRCTSSACFQRLGSCIKSKYFDFLMDSLLFVLMVVQAVETRDADNNSVRNFKLILYLTFGLFMFETLLKIMVMGWKGYIRKVWNQWDLVFDVLYLVAVVVSNTAHGSGTPRYVAEGSGAVLSRIVQSTRFTLHVVLRNASHMLPRLVNSGATFSSGMNVTFSLNTVVSKILRSIYTLGISFLCISFAFAFLGVALFGGMVNTDPQSENYKKLQDTRYAEENFYNLNFNDMPSAFVTLVCILHVSDFDILAAAFSALTSAWATLYFVAWYIIGVLLLLNIVKSFFLSEFLVFALGKQESSLTRASTGDPNEFTSYRSSRHSSGKQSPALSAREEAALTIKDPENAREITRIGDGGYGSAEGGGHSNEIFTPIYSSAAHEGAGRIGALMAATSVGLRRDPNSDASMDRGTDTAPTGMSGKMHSSLGALSGGRGGSAATSTSHTQPPLTYQSSGKNVSSSSSTSVARMTKSSSSSSLPSSQKDGGNGPKAKRIYVVGMKTNSGSFHDTDGVPETDRTHQRESSGNANDSDFLVGEVYTERERRMSFFTANTDTVKDLEPHELEQLHFRLNQLALSHDSADSDGRQSDLSDEGDVMHMIRTLHRRSTLPLQPRAMIDAGSISIDDREESKEADRSYMAGMAADSTEAAPASGPGPGRTRGSSLGIAGMMQNVQPFAAPPEAGAGAGAGAGAAGEVITLSTSKTIEDLLP